MDGQSTSSAYAMRPASSGKPNKRRGRGGFFPKHVKVHHGSQYPYDALNAMPAVAPKPHKRTRRGGRGRTRRRGQHLVEEQQRRQRRGGLYGDDDAGDDKCSPFSSPSTTLLPWWWVHMANLGLTPAGIAPSFEDGFPVVLPSTQEVFILPTARNPHRASTYVPRAVTDDNNNTETTTENGDDDEDDASSETESVSSRAVSTISSSSSSSSKWRDAAATEARSTAFDQRALLTPDALLEANRATLTITVSYAAPATKMTTTATLDDDDDEECTVCDDDAFFAFLNGDEADADDSDSDCASSVDRSTIDDDDDAE